MAIERKQNQQLLMQSEEEYKPLFENNPVPIKHKRTYF
jgi:hypothetical protein